MEYKGVITRVKPNGLAQEIGLEPGDRIITVNGEKVVDLIDLSFALADDYVELLVEKKDGTQELLEVEKDYDEDFGVEFESAVFDRVRQCANKCIFCFVDQMPPGMRESLYVKDDDYRLSFLYGNFVTLTNMVSRDLERIKRLHLSPLYVSIHTTDGQLREKMLGNRRAAQIMEQLQSIFQAGIDIHTQVVLCPGINDGEQLDRTIADLLKLRPRVLSLAIVPVGLTRYRKECFHIEPFTREQAAIVVNQVEQWQKKCRQHGNTFVYLADEFYLKANLPIPEYEFYDEFPQLENGVGIVRSFIDEWRNSDIKGAGYKTPQQIDVVCGLSAASVLGPLLAEVEIPNLKVRLVAVENAFFGPHVTVSGLLTGGDIINTLETQPDSRTGVIIPGVALRKGETIFLDNKSLAEIEKRLDVPVRAAYSAQNLRQMLADWR